MSGEKKVSKCHKPAGKSEELDPHSLCILCKQAIRKNQVWGMDFIFDRTANGRPIKILVVLDECTRENLALEVSRTLKSHDVIRVLDELTARRGAPENIRSDNGPEFIADVINS